VRIRITTAAGKARYCDVVRCWHYKIGIATT